MEQNTRANRGAGIRGRAWVKAAALILAIACGVGAGAAWLYCGVHRDTLFREGDYTGSADWYRAMNRYYALLYDRTELEWEMRAGRELTYLEQRQYESLTYQLDPDCTNFRYTVRDNATGALLLSSSGEDSLENAGSVYASLQSYRPDAWEEADPVQWAVEYGVEDVLTVRDDFFLAKETFTQGNISYFYLALALTAGFVSLFVFLLCCAGRRRGHEAYVLNWVDKFPYDLFLWLMGWAGIFALGGLFSVLEGVLYHDVYHRVQLTAAGAALAVFLGLLLVTGMSTATRCKTGTLLRNTLLWRGWNWLRRLCRRVWRALAVVVSRADLTLRVVLGGLIYLAVNAFLSFGLFLRGSMMCLLLLLAVNGAVLALVCRWTVAWADLRAATAAIVSGHPGQAVDTSQMRYLPALRRHAEQLGDLGSAIDLAVRERMQSERMKAELITNVSHDLKTPLTSIINYVDLLKKEDIQNPAAAEYIAVLDRKSQRLKRLTEDLVEASKASTGALAVEKERLGVAQLVTQALGEYAERFAASGLTAVVSLPEEEAFISADGRHMWRILDNLLSNCVKYALSGTRVYLTLTREDDAVVLSVKNISAQQLNIPAGQLMERFVRGDESRTTEGSGLGLSIARSLTELQGGEFQLCVDGDLFKATARFPGVE